MAGKQTMDPHASTPDLSLMRLRVFAAVADQGGYSAAARSLGLSQPTVSFHVQALEQAFSTTLLVYRERRVHLTAPGEALYALARRTLRDAAELTAQIAGLAAGQAGRVRLAVSIAFEQAFFFREVIAPFARAHPDIELCLRFGTSRQMVEAIRTREADLAYVMHCHMPSDVRYQPLHHSRAVFFAAETHPLAAQPGPEPAQAGDIDLIAAPLDSAEWEYYGQVIRDTGLRHYRIALEITGIQARVLAAQAGLGVLAAFWPAYAGPATLPGLQPVQIGTDPPNGPEFGLVQRREEPVMRSVTALASWVRHVTANGEAPSSA
jgi:DNA-binding transcriptional LysR family regulator